VTWRGVFSGALALIALEAAIRTPESAGRVGELLRSVAGLVQSAMSPAVPLVPDLAGAGYGTYSSNPGGGSSDPGGGTTGGGGGGNGGGGSW